LAFRALLCFRRRLNTLHHLADIRLRADLLRHSLARLSPEHGEVIDLVYFHGKSIKEVAEIVGDVLCAQEVGGFRCSGLDSK
jgi:DNA-directed RNA polymerase specialized sigma24 family protein